MNYTAVGFQPLARSLALPAAGNVTAKVNLSAGFIARAVKPSHPRLIVDALPDQHPLQSQLPNLHVGDIIDNRYVVRGLIGAGGMGVVIQAHDRVTREEVAMKITSLDHIDTLEDEIEITRILSGTKKKTNIPKLIGEGTVKAHKFGVFEYIQGRTLAEEIDRRTKISLPEALKIISELASVLMVAESQGIVHRDIKPENVILRKDNGEAVLFDWGLSRKKARDGFAFGTPDYMPPEALRGMEAGHSRDIYALGIMLWEMLNGHLPFGAASLTGSLAILQQLGVKENGLPPIGEMPEYNTYYNRTYALVESMTSPQREFRLQSATELKQRVDELRAKIEVVKIDIKEFEREIENLFPEPHLPAATGSITILTPVIGVDIAPT